MRWRQYTLARSRISGKWGARRGPEARELRPGSAMRIRLLGAVALIGLPLLAGCSTDSAVPGQGGLAPAADPAQRVEWPVHGGDQGAQRYSPLEEITPDNVASLELAWAWRTGERELFDDAGIRIRPGSFEATPLMLADTLYISTPYHHAVALDAAILVVSAQDGPMPQTREHIQLASKKGIKSIVVYINKVDLINDAELVDLVELEVRELLTAYGFNGKEVPFIRGSALMALVGTRNDIGGNTIIELLRAMDKRFAGNKTERRR